MSNVCVLFVHICPRHGHNDEMMNKAFHKMKHSLRLLTRVQSCILLYSCFHKPNNINAHTFYLNWKCRMLACIRHNMLAHSLGQHISRTSDIQNQHNRNLHLSTQMCCRNNFKSRGKLVENLCCWKNVRLFLITFVRLSAFLCCSSWLQNIMVP